MSNSHDVNDMWVEMQSHHILVETYVYMHGIQKISQITKSKLLPVHETCMHTYVHTHTQKDVHTHIRTCICID